MTPFSERLPKPMLPILGKPLIQYHVESLRNLGINRIVVAVGHLGFAIASVLGDGASLGVHIEYVDQATQLGSAHALNRLEPIVNDPFVLILGDIFYFHSDLMPMITMLGDGVDGVLAVKKESLLDAIRRNYVVFLDANGFVTRVVEKPRYPKTNVKGCGLYAFTPNFFDALRRTPRTVLRDEYELTDAIQVFLDDGYKVRAAEVIEEDVNLTFPEDVLRVNLRVLGDREMIGNNVRLAPGCSVRRSVIMDGATIEKPVRIEESLIFPNVSISGGEDIVRCIVTDSRRIPCS